MTTRQTAPTTGSRRPSTTSVPGLTGSLTRLVDRAVGDRVKGSIDRRVRRDVRRAIGEERRRAEAAAGVAARQAEVTARENETRLEDLVTRTVKEQLSLRAQESETEKERRIHAEHRSFTVDTLLGAGARTSRILNPGRYRTLVTEMTELTGRKNLGDRTQHAFRLLLHQEGQGLGRIAGSTYNILGKLVVPPLLNPPPGRILEIGTLYGLFSPSLVQQFRRVGEFRSLTVVDPFAGVQLQPGTASGGDQTGTPVTQEVAHRNLLASGLRPDELEVVCGFSDDAAVQEQVGARDYAVVVIDGDHSEEGVYRDLWWVETITAPGGVVVMDDFGDPRWEGVERAARRYLADGGRLELLGTASTSAYLRMPA